jgi:hypothetical protein
VIILRPHTSSRPRRKHKPVAALAALLLVLTGALAAQETSWHLLVEPAFMRPDFAFPIPGSKSTILTPATIKDGEATYLTKAEAARLKLDLESIRRVASTTASAELARLKPEFVRDAHGVILYARLTSDSPATASTVLAPNFAKTFADTLGPDILVAIPNRYRVYVYPALASDPAQTAALILRDYELSPYPVSKEVFRVTPQGLAAVGTFETP